MSAEEPARTKVFSNDVNRIIDDTSILNDRDSILNTPIPWVVHHRPKRVNLQERIMLGGLAAFVVTLTGSICAYKMAPQAWMPFRTAGGIAVCTSIVVSVAPMAWEMWGKDRAPRIRAGVMGFSVQSLTSLAAILAGRQGPALYAEWNAVLRGRSGHDPASWAKVKMAAGCVVAGARDRGQDWADAAWRPADAVLRSRFLSGLFVVAPTIVDAAVVLQYRGPVQVLISFSSIFGAGAALSLAIKGGRKHRDIELPKPKGRQAGK